MPAMPVTCTRWARDCSAEAWNGSLTRRSSRSRPTKGASRPSERRAPPRAAVTRTARHSGTGSTFPFRTCSPACSKAIACSLALRRLDDPAPRRLRGRLDPGRGVDRSPATIPSPTAARLTAASPVNTARAGPELRRPDRVTERRAGRDEHERRRRAASASASCGTGVPETAMTASPMNFSTVPPYSSTSRRHVSK